MSEPIQSLDERIVTCRRCPRLVEWREAVAHKKRRAYAVWDYWGKPVPGFGDPDPAVLVIGLAPGAHGSNRTGRMFTGDDSGVFLYRALYKAGFANQPNGLERGDGLSLRGVYITAVCRCAPPDNKPLPSEVLNCRPFLEEEIDSFHNLQGIVLLGRVAMDGLIGLYRSRGISLPPIEFAHNRLQRFEDGSPWWLTSYHPSRQNTQTGRLTEDMFDQVWEQVKNLTNL